jgi:glycosyltransferase involved in cell wall biosynthesis
MTNSVSVVIPVYNERESLVLLAGQVVSNLEQLALPFEVIFVDDGSRDGSRDAIWKLTEQDRRFRGIALRRNFGKAAALAAGFEASRGDIVITLDADLQDDPAEIPKFLKLIRDGNDVVSGWKRQRHDRWTRVLASRLFNATTRLLTGVPLHDMNCGFKAYRREALQGLKLYGELHRYIPALVSGAGFVVTEVAVMHHARPYGRSKYTIQRYVRGLIDLLTVLFLMRFRTRPAHLFGGIGLVFLMAGMAISVYMAWLWVSGVRPIGSRPLFALGLFLVIVGLQSTTFGLLAEMLTNLFHRNEDTYAVMAAAGEGLAGSERFARVR